MTYSCEQEMIEDQNCQWQYEAEMEAEMQFQKERI